MRGRENGEAGLEFRERGETPYSGTGDGPEGIRGPGGWEAAEDGRAGKEEGGDVGTGGGERGGTTLERKRGGDLERKGSGEAGAPERGLGQQGAGVKEGWVGFVAKR